MTYFFFCRFSDFKMFLWDWMTSVLNVLGKYGEVIVRVPSSLFCICAAKRCKLFGERQALNSLLTQKNKMCIVYFKIYFFIIVYQIRRSLSNNLKLETVHFHPSVIIVMFVGT